MTNTEAIAELRARVAKLEELAPKCPLSELADDDVGRQRQFSLDDARAELAQLEAQLLLPGG